MRKKLSALPLPRFIDPASIDIGDTVRVAWEVEDILISRTGTVARREYEGGMRVLYTKGDAEIFRWHPNHKVKVTLLEKAKPTHTMLDLFAESEV